ncbi:hypothetical protein JR316_0005926 [Psilocybe cubensis]|uniref:Uncharacterized protein n=1 Tax=Psilocybe cubensis TaxID=181762 RepID=A0ACB8H2H7_PSICU|nr:hypothetical protein JR316_0005926 [Psilocybe cubensis]KAH9481400.1 hypothetical protein JR316_0005926 [Psilocybe cubensis]
MTNSNAVAGPSSMPSLIPHYSSSPSPPPPAHHYPRPPTPPLLFLPPAPGVRQQPKQHLESTQDLLARFHLHPAYDKYVRPLVTPGDDFASAPTHDQHAPPVDGATERLDKGKGKERDPATAAVTPGPSGATEADHADGPDADDDDAAGGKGEKKKKNSYKHLIKGLPGKHSFKKDEELTKIMLAPPKQRMRILQFDAKTQEDAFTVSAEGLKGWNINALVLESAQAREDRKKRKEARRLAKLQQAQAQANGVALHHADSTTGASTPQPSFAGTTPGVSTPGVAQPQPVKASMQASAGVGGSGIKKPGGIVPGRTGTPRTAAGAGVGTPRPVSAAPQTTVAVPSPVIAAQASVGGGSGVAGGPATIPRSTSTIPRPGSAVPRPGSTVPKPGSVPMKQQQPLRSGTPMDVDQQRGKKRERDDGGTVNGAVNGNGNGAHMNGHNGHSTANGTQQFHPGHHALNSKAGTGNIRPRPIKKQRMLSRVAVTKDMQGQARDVNGPVQQQPTPQGV